MPTPRRRFLQSVAGLAAVPAAAAALPTVRLGKHEITRLVIGENPLYGYSHFNRLLDRMMSEWCTSDRVAGILRRAEECGLNTWEFTHSERSMEDLRRFQDQGGKLQWVLLSSREMEANPGLIDKMAALHPMGMAPHGGVTDRLFRIGQKEMVREYLKRVRQAGVLAGLSTHTPEVVERVEDEGWDLDFYMTCCYRLTRTPEEIRQITRELPLPGSEVYLEGDPARMFRVVRQTRRTCLAFKILAAGRLTATPEMIDQAFRRAFDSIKPNDCVIVGMFPMYSDQVAENAQRVRRILGAS